MNTPPIMFSIFIISVLSSNAASAITPINVETAPGEDQFHQIDIDKDEYITFDEFLEWHRHWLEWKFSHLDKDNNGRLSVEEYQVFEQKEKKEKEKMEKESRETPLK